MSDYQKLKSSIQNCYPELSKNQKKIADFVLNNFDRIPFQSVQEISEATSLSVASIVRFAQRIGFEGFLQMREQIAKSLQHRIKKQQIFSLIDNNKLEDDTFASVANHDINIINDTLHSLDRAHFDSSIKMLVGARKVYTAGLGISYLLSEILSYQLNQVAIEASCLIHTHTSFMEQVLTMTKKDVIVAFSLPPYSNETIDAVKYAKSKGIKTIAITNKESSPVTFYSETQLVIKSKNMLFTNSFASTAVLINAIATECAIRNKTKANKMLKQLNEVVNKQKLVSTDQP